jgi:MFS transporter, BCD family, chlorophyll transporter
VSAMPALRGRSLRPWMIGGCIVSGAALLMLGGCGLLRAPAMLRPLLFLLGAANGCYAIGAVGSMMQLVGSGAPAREGLRMGLWGAAQAVAFGLGGLAATIGIDICRHIFVEPAPAYATVFVLQAIVFVYATTLVMFFDRVEVRRQVMPNADGVLRLAEAKRG